MSGGWRINDYEEKRQEREAARQQQAREGRLDDIYTPVKFEISQKEAKRLPALRRIVALHMKQATFPEAMQGLHRKYGIAFLSNAKQAMPQKADVSLPPMPLGEALDRLTEIYQETEWEYRRYGFLVIRAPGNPARTLWAVPTAQQPAGNNAAQP